MMHSGGCPDNGSGLFFLGMFSDNEFPQSFDYEVELILVGMCMRALTLTRL